MNFLDIIGMSVSNLWRRKLRTFLTVLGVMIGTASIVVMVSLGIGLKTAVMKDMESYGSLTEVNVNYYSWDSSSDIKLNDTAVASFLDIPYVTGATPILSISGELLQGKYAAWINLRGVSEEYMKKIPLAEGDRYPTSDGATVELLLGNTVITDFYQTNNYNYPYYETGELADVDLRNKTLFTKFESTWDSNGMEQPSKKNIFPVVGMVAGGLEEYNQYSYSAYTNIDALKNYLKKTYKGKVIPGQPTDKNGKPYKEFVYNEAIVSVDSTEHVSDVIKAISDMGFSAYSQAEWIKQTESQMAIIQAVLGGIGAVALLVAAIGIANTMMMSTYERTKEIGVMKVLGCSLSNIRGLFLTEAAFIGLIGGMVGLIISYILSFVCNILLAGMLTSASSKISLIPWWLALCAVVFSAMVGIVAGFFPAQRATKLSPLAAIRNE